MNTWGWYALGLGTAIAARVASRPVVRTSRPLFRGVIKGGLILNRELQRLTEEARASLADLTAEAKAELEDAAPDDANTP